MQAITAVVFERYRLLDLSDARFQLSASVIEIKRWVLITELVNLAEHAQVLLAEEFSAISSTCESRLFYSSISRHFQII